jgi:hypothetical protein
MVFLFIWQATAYPSVVNHTGIVIIDAARYSSIAGVLVIRTGKDNMGFASQLVCFRAGSMALSVRKWLAFILSGPVIGSALCT